MIRQRCARRVGAAIVIASAGVLLPDPANAQGAGSTGATVLQLLAGSRAAALSGAYAGATTDADVLFYNPAGIAALSGAAGASYQKHVEDIGVATGAGAFRVGRIVLGASAIFLDYGSVDELVPDPDFGGQTGMPTGNSVGASEVAARVAAATPLMEGRLHVGAAVGLVTTSLADASRGTAVFDFGAQYLLPRITLGAALRNVGSALSGGGLADAPMPTEARFGAMVELSRATGVGAIASADLVHELNAGTTGLVAGVEAGLLQRSASDIGAVARLGYNGSTGSDGQGAIQFGGGLSLGAISIDYAYQNYDLFGALHRFGVRWTRMP
ncbi:MAG: hypothetical protein L0271_23285 [Gemmatimonadetes bacterium]|nr:hypothetical protein [Gemmatimonadota bacterium]